MRVVKIREGGVVRKVRLLDDEGCPVEAVCQFLEHLVDRGSSPNTLCAYGYDLQHLFTFLHREQLDWRQFGPADTLRGTVNLKGRAGSRHVRTVVRRSGAGLVQAAIETP